MKKLIALLLAALMIVGICGCTGGQTTETTETTEGGNDRVVAPYDGSIPAVEGFQVGFGRMEILPEESVPIAGLGRSTSRMSTTVHDTMYVSCYAVTDAEGTTILMFSLDLQRPDMNIFGSVRMVLSRATGIPEDHIFFTATHTHSGPDTYSSHQSIAPYKQKVAAQSIQAAYAAIADRKPATMAYSSIETENMNFVKHYKYVDENGVTKFFGDNFGTATYNETTTHTTEADQTLHVLHFAREGGKDLVLANWRAHPHLFTSSTSYKLSADYPGAFRTAMESLYDCYFAYFQGAAGNMNSSSRISSEVRTKEYGEYGRIMAEYVIEAMQNETQVTDTTIQTRQTKQELEQNHLEDHLVGVATIVNGAWQNGATFSEAVSHGAAYGIHSPYHAGAIISKSKLGSSFVSELNAVAIGDTFCFVTAPHELFDTNSAWLEENSPYSMTMTFGYTNGMNGYVPSAYCWEYGSYEVDCTNTMPGTGEFIQEVFLGMLEEMKAE